MSDAKFTKGPWNAFHPIKLLSSCFITVEGENGILIYCREVHRRTLEEHTANANLISKAPEMYEMLHKMQSVMYHLSNEIELRDDKRIAFRDDFSRIKELLSKVRGEQNN